MILTGDAIHKAYQEGDIMITPFDESQLNPNSYNLCLAPELNVYVPKGWTPSHFHDHYAFPTMELDCKKPLDIFKFTIPFNGMMLFPGKIYLGATVEFTQSDRYIPMIEGRSSLARLGLSVHQTGGFGDLGFAGHWTLEFACIEPVRIYAGMQIAQLQFWECCGDTTRRYKGKYQNQQGPTPSKLYEEMKKHD